MKNTDLSFIKLEVLKRACPLYKIVCESQEPCATERVEGWHSHVLMIFKQRQSTKKETFLQDLKSLTTHYCVTHLLRIKFIGWNSDFSPFFFSADFQGLQSLQGFIGDYDADDMVQESSGGIGCTVMDDLLASYEPPVDMHLQNLWRDRI